MVRVNQVTKLDPGCLVGGALEHQSATGWGVALIGLECTFLCALGTHFCNIRFTTSVLAVPTSGYGF